MGDSLTNEQRDEFKAAFDYFDKEKKGRLGAADYALLMRSLGENVSESEATSLAGSGGVALETLLANRQEKWANQRSGETLRVAFGVLDRWGQGTVDAEDLKYMVTAYGNAPLTAQEADELCRIAGGGAQIKYADLIETMLKKKA